jgi:hypothetical protein
MTRERAFFLHNRKVLPELRLRPEMQRDDAGTL